MDHDKPDQSTQILKGGQHRHVPKKRLETTLNASTAILILNYIIYFFTL